MIIVVLAVLGLILGSFVNALVWRVHEQSKGKRSESKGKSSLTPKLSALSPTKLSILRGRSLCVHCGHILSSRDLIPVFSWLWLRGKCRYCHKPISVQYPIVEALTAGLFVVSYIFWPYEFGLQGTVIFGFWLLFLTGLIALAVYDIRWMILPNKIIYPLMYVGMAQAVVLLALSDSPTHILTNLLLSVLMGGGIFYLLFQVSNGKWIGGGDVKLGALLGLILADWQLIIMTIFGASIIGTLIALPLMLAGKLRSKTRIPFGPLLIVGAIIARLFGLSIINWYKTKLMMV